MTYNYLQSRQHYEDRYDETTIEKCRMGERIVNKTFIEMGKKLPESEKKEHQAGWYLMYSKLYFGYVEAVAAERRDGREKRIAAWMEADEKKDRRLADAKMKNPYCKTCGKDMEQISKDYMSRDRGGSGREDDILFMFDCKPCNKRIAVWQDGTKWGHKEPHCEKCGTAMKHSSSKSQGVYTSTDTCPKCGLIDTYEFDLNDKDEPEEPEDPYLELDRKRLCFDDEMESKYEQKLNHLLRMAKLELDTEEHVEHVDIYEAIKDIKQPKIAQLSDLLKEALAKGGYRDFKLGDPELGQQVVVGFSCLDEKPDRKEYDSKKSLQKLVNKMLGDTNWRLMSEGINYRLGFLSGRLKAYEKEEDLKKLIEQRIKDGTYTLPEREPVKITEKSEAKPKYKDIPTRETILIYMDKLLLGSHPAEITLKSRKKKRTSISYITGEMNPLLRIIIPMREGDESVPDFIRNYDFKFGPKDDEKPKVTKDSQGRETRLL
jgi:hypothetical protein